MFQRSAPWMFPNPHYHDQVGAGVRVGDAPPPLLRPLVPVPAVLAGLRRRPAGHADRPRLPPPGPGHQRDQRRRPRGVHASTWPTRSATTPSCSPRSCPTTSASASARCRTTAAGSARSPATTSTWSPSRSPRSRPTGVVDRPTASSTTSRRHRLRHRLPRQPVPLADGDRRPRRRRAGRAVGRRARPPTSASPCPTSPTSSASTARPPTWPTAAASSSTPSARCAT